MATATFSDRESAEKAVKTLHLDRKKLSEEVIYDSALSQIIRLQTKVVLSSELFLRHGVDNRTETAAQLNINICASEGLEKAYVEYAQLMSRIWKTLVAWTRRNMKTLPGFLIR